MPKTRFSNRHDTRISYEAATSSKERLTSGSWHREVNHVHRRKAASEVGCGVSTASTHLSNAYRKLGVPDKTQAVLVARENDWI